MMILRGSFFFPTMISFFLGGGVLSTIFLSSGSASGLGVQTLNLVIIFIII